jgi:hypothetical protein
LKPLAVLAARALPAAVAVDLLHVVAPAKVADKANPAVPLAEAKVTTVAVVDKLVDMHHAVLPAAARTVRTRGVPLLLHQPDRKALPQHPLR